MNNQFLGTKNKLNESKNIPKYFSSKILNGLKKEKELSCTLVLLFSATHVACFGQE